MAPRMLLCFRVLCRWHQRESAPLNREVERVRVEFASAAGAEVAGREEAVAGQGTTSPAPSSWLCPQPFHLGAFVHRALCTLSFHTARPSLTLSLTASRNIASEPSSSTRLPSVAGPRRCPLACVRGDPVRPASILAACLLSLNSVSTRIAVSNRFFVSVSSSCHRSSILHVRRNLL